MVCGVQPLLLSRLVLADENDEAHAPGNPGGQRLIQPRGAVFDGTEVRTRSRASSATMLPRPFLTRTTLLDDWFLASGGSAG